MKITRVVIYILVLFYVVPLYALHKGIYPVKKPHEGVNMKPKEAHNLCMSSSGFGQLDKYPSYEVVISV
jgi:hypothetical protein